MNRYVPLAVGCVLAVGWLPAMASASPAPTLRQVRTSASVTLNPAGGVLTQVAAISLPAGPWTVTTNATAVNFGAGDFVRCQLRKSGVLMDGGATVFLANRVAGIANAGTLAPTAPVTVALLCGHDHTAAAGQFYLDPGATITAVRGGPIVGPGLSGTKPTVVQSRSTTSLSLSQVSTRTIAQIKLAAGTWSLNGIVTAVNFGDFDWAACSFTSTSGSLVDSFREVGTNGTDAAAANVDLEGSATVPAGGATVRLSCSSAFTSGVYVDPGASITATRTAATIAPIGTLNLNDGPGVQTTVASRSLPAGTWRIRASVSVGNHNSNSSWGGGRDFVRCRLLAGGTMIDGGATAQLTADSVIEDVVNAGTYHATAAWTLKETCSHDAAHTGDGHWSTHTGDLQAISGGTLG